MSNLGNINSKAFICLKPNIFFHWYFVDAFVYLLCSVFNRNVNFVLMNSEPIFPVWHYTWNKTRVYQAGLFHLYQAMPHPLRSNLDAMSAPDLRWHPNQSLVFKLCFFSKSRNDMRLNSFSFHKHDLLLIMWECKSDYCTRCAWNRSRPFPLIPIANLPHLPFQFAYFL